jgi:chemotaxis protein methyltransferase CheR
VAIQATDLSTRVLDRARAAVWPLAKASEIPAALLHEYMLKGVGSQEGRMKAGPAIREVVHFAQLNLNEERYPVPTDFDLVFCRNVLIYFDKESKAKSLKNIGASMLPHSYLFLSQTETLFNIEHPFDLVHFFKASGYKVKG